MGALTKDTPKPLLVVRGKSFLDHIFDSLPIEVTEVIVVVGYRGEKIRAYLGNRYKGRDVFYVEQKEHTGPAKAFLLTRRFFTRQSERFFIIHGDELPSRREMQACLSHRYSLLCHELTSSISTGLVQIDRKGRVTRIAEKRFGVTPPCISDGGVMLVDTHFFTFRPRKHPKTGEYYLTSMLAPFLKRYPVYAVMGGKDLYFSTPADIDRFNKDK